jgi:hypothetical protein
MDTKIVSLGKASRETKGDNFGPPDPSGTGATLRQP